MTTRLPNDCFALPPGVDWTPVDDALDHLEQRLGPVVGHDTIDIDHAMGCVLAADVTAPRAHPPTSNAAVDGYAVHGDGGRFDLLTGRAAAGVPFDGVVGAGQAVRILTGAPVPKGADRIVLQEDTQVTDGSVHFDAKLKRGANIRSAGEDMTAGDVILHRGRILTAGDIGILATVGIGAVRAFHRLKVAVISTGDELRPAGQTADDHQIFDANRPMLMSLLRGWGFDVLDIGIIRDDRDQVHAALDRAAQADVIIASGGASAGDEDHMAALLNETGSMAIWRIAVKPGRPLGLGVWQGVPVFALPGNPVAAYVCTCIFARPAMRAMAGAGFMRHCTIPVTADFTKTKKSGRREYLRARLGPDGRAQIFTSEGSGRISGLSWADGLVELPDGAALISPGDTVQYIPFKHFY